MLRTRLRRDATMPSPEEDARLTKRLDHCKQVYGSQFSSF